ncbi:MAG: carbohydrate ABC transporter permease [Chloroflexota bacterium]
MPKNNNQTRLYYASLWFVAILFFLPIFWIILAALKTPNDILAIPPKFIFTPTFDNILNTIAEDNTIPYFINSIFLSIGSVIVATAVSFLGAYAFSRYKFASTNFLMFLLLSTRMVPAAAAVVPIFQMFNAFSMRNTFGVFMLYAMFSIPFSIWILKGFIDGVSERFDETGLVNGASRIHVIFRVVLPQVVPGLIAAFIFNLIFVWNEFLFNFILGGRTTQMIPYALAVGLVDAGGNIDWAFIASLSTMYVLLPVVMIFFFQKYLLVGMTFGTVRGEV